MTWAAGIRKTSALALNDVAPAAGAQAEITFATSGFPTACDETDAELAVAKRAGLNNPSGCSFGLCGSRKAQRKPQAR